MVLPPYSLEELNSSFVAGHNYSSQLRAKNVKYQNTNRLSKPTPMSSVHMAKDIYRKGVSQSSTRASNFANNSNSHGAYRRDKQQANVLNTSAAPSQKRSSTYVRYAQRVGSNSQNRTLNLYLQDSEPPYHQPGSTLGVINNPTKSILTKDESLVERPAEETTPKVLGTIDEYNALFPIINNYNNYNIN